MSVLVAMSGGVDSSVAAALLRDEGHEVVGRHDEAVGRRERLGLLLGRRCRRRAAGRAATRHRPPRLQLHRRLRRARRRPVRRRPPARPHAEPVHRVQPPPQVRPVPPAAPRSSGSTRSPPGHHARIVRSTATAGGCSRGADAAKDQSYVLSMLGQDALGAAAGSPSASSRRPRSAPARRALGLRTAAKPESQDVCFILASRRSARRSSADRMPLHPGAVVDGGTGDDGRHGRCGRAGDGRPAPRARHRRRREPRYAVAVDVPTARGHRRRAEPTSPTGLHRFDGLTWVGDALPARHRRARADVGPRRAAPATFTGCGLCDGRCRHGGSRRARRVAFYDEADINVLGSALAR